MKIVTYNIHKGMDKDNKYTLNKIDKYFKNIDADIICIQEVLYLQFIYLKNYLFMEGHFACNVSNKSIKYGICTLSKQKIINHTHMFLNSKTEQRGILSIEIENFNIINTHLGLDKAERKQQLDEIINYMNQISTEKILCGDFNEKNISIYDLKDCAIETKKYDEPTFDNTSSRIDYIFIDKKISIVDYIVPKLKLSDHYPIIIKI